TDARLRRGGHIHLFDPDPRGDDAAQTGRQFERGASDVVSPRNQRVGVRKLTREIGSILRLGEADLALGDEARHLLFEPTRCVVARTVQDDDRTGHGANLLLVRCWMWQY